jgi:hypothetical protein
MYVFDEAKTNIEDMRIGNMSLVYNKTDDRTTTVITTTTKTKTYSVPVLSKNAVLTFPATKIPS